MQTAFANQSDFQPRASDGIVAMHLLLPVTVAYHERGQQDMVELCRHRNALQPRPQRGWEGAQRRRAEAQVDLRLGVWEGRPDQ